MSEHLWTQERLAECLTGGLLAEERERVRRHVGDCAECFAEMAGLGRVDQQLNDLFAAVQPAAGWESQVIAALRGAPAAVKRSWPGWFRYVAAVAALILLGLVGAGTQLILEEGHARSPENERSVVKNHLKPLEAKDKESLDSFSSLMKWTTHHGQNHVLDGTSSMESLEQWARRPLDSVTFSPDGQQTVISSDGVAMFHDLSPHTFGFGVDVNYNLERRSGISVPGASDLADKKVGLGTGRMATTYYHRIPVVDSPPRQKTAEAKREGESLQADGERKVTKDKDAKRLEDLMDLAVDITKESATTSLGRTDKGKQEKSGKTTSQGLAAELAEEIRQAKAAQFNLPTASTPATESGLPAAPPRSLAGAAPEKKDTSLGGYFRLTLGAGDKDAPPDKLAQLAGKANQDQKENKKEEPKKGPAAKEEPPAEKKPEQTLSDNRKIIRSGEVEFEVDSFQNAVAVVNQLIDAIPNAFVATTNSEKLPNGKVRGSVVVRMSPGKLDRFLTDLRQNLGKLGDLLSQRIGSSDVTKAYFDLESRLKAARTMEERLLNIIKSGKGEIKDLLAAERELGVWRTKIEEMEGEIRYYNNQITLSTLTITLQEKEIRAAATMVVSEKVVMRIETEEVEKAQQDALAIVAAAKGRVLKADLKQHAGGQLEAILEAEVAPETADQVRAEFKKLGIVTGHEAERTQQAQGGDRTLDGKTRKNDVQFRLTLYNVANIQPRETHQVKLAFVDVPAAYRKLQDAVAKAKGQVRKAQLNEQDKLNVTGELEFAVPKAQRDFIEKTLTEVGGVFGRTVSQAKEGASITDSKVGYELNLRNVAGIPPREKVTLGIEVKNVEASAAALSDMVAASKGLVHFHRVIQTPNGRVTALLAFDVPAAAKDELVRKFKDAGIVRAQDSSSNPQATATDLATARLDVTLVNAEPLLPSDEGVGAQIHSGLTKSLRVLSMSVMWIVLGVCLLLPFGLVAWVGWRMVRKWRQKM
jgi:hypothetical protein